MEHYFIPRNYDKKDILEYGAVLFGRPYTFYSLKGLFSYQGVDEGTMALLNAIMKSGEELHGNVLDLGCGIGVIGIVLAKNYKIELTMSDVNSNAIDIASMNVQKHGVSAKVVESDSFENLKDRYEYIIINPPIKAGKQVLFDMVLKSYYHLFKGGKIILVIRKDLGMESLKKAMFERFGNVNILSRDKGYYILESEKWDDITMSDNIDKKQDIFKKSEYMEEMNVDIFER